MYFLLGYIFPLLSLRLFLPLSYKLEMLLRQTGLEYFGSWTITEPSKFFRNIGRSG